MKRCWTVSPVEADSRCLKFYGDGTIQNPIEGSPAIDSAT